MNTLLDMASDMFRKTPAEVLAQRELDQNKRLLLEAQRCKDYYIKMVDFYETRIRALSGSSK